MGVINSFPKAPRAGRSLLLVCKDKATGTIFEAELASMHTVVPKCPMPPSTADPIPDLQTNDDGNDVEGQVTEDAATHQDNSAAAAALFLSQSAAEDVNDPAPAAGLVGQSTIIETTTGDELGTMIPADPGDQGGDDADIPSNSMGARIRRRTNSIGDWARLAETTTAGNVQPQPKKENLKPGPYTRVKGKLRLGRDGRGSQVVLEVKVVLTVLEAGLPA